MERQAIQSEGIILALRFEMSAMMAKSKKLQVAPGGNKGSSRVSSRVWILFWEQRGSAKAIKTDTNLWFGWSVEGVPVRKDQGQEIAGMDLN